MSGASTCKTRARSYITLAVDICHGRMSVGVNDLSQLRALMQRKPFEVRLLAHSLTIESLSGVDVLVIVSIGHTGKVTFEDSEVTAISQFVSNGGGLLCAGQAWSWVYQAYGNKPAETFPLNVLGRALGFFITGENVDGPVPLETEITSGLQVIDRGGWVPSRIELKSSQYVPFIRDENGKTIAIYGEHGAGRIVVVGHEGMFEGNLQLLLNVLTYLTRKPIGP